MGLATYWVVRGRLLAGAYPGSLDHRESAATLASLLSRGMRAFLDLTEEQEVSRFGPVRRYEQDLQAVAAEAVAPVSYARYPIPDMGVPSPGLMSSILDALDAALGAGRPAYLHCLGGRGRTGTVVGCYLVRHSERLLGTARGDEMGALALTRIADLREAQGVPFAESSPETEAQRAFVMQWRPGM